MKITVNSELLADALEEASKAISNKTLTPILSGFLIRANESGIDITGKDDRVTIQSYIPGEHVDIIRQGSVVFPKLFQEIIKKINGEVLIDVNDKFEASITSNNKEVEIVGLDPSEFPQAPEVSQDETVSISGKDLKDWIKKTSFAVSTDDKARILAGVNVILGDGKIKMLATDRNRLARIEKEIKTSDLGSTVVEGRGLTDLEKIVQDKDDVEFGFSKSVSGDVIYVFVRTDRFTFYSRVLEGEFPDAERLVRSAKTITELKVNKKEFMQSIDLIYTLAKEEKNSAVRLSVTENEVLMNGKGKVMGKASESIFPKSFSGEPFKISLNAKYMIEALKAIESNEVTVRFNGKMSPVILQGDESEGSLYVVLPYRTEA
ncbi:DNA polymerase III subunit beta [Paenibacillus macerans]|uniref:Beta sliding clamp n=1 Tax=Paenibacillus macerans TaxID=44252 RepID=A0A6N8F481_PAEMA|nr:DNA polymerase III subunit beta [Paenibacillus macerans]MUG26020.1 DNA polymerase III subunit beta [Paenibacillus macerans]